VIGPNGSGKSNVIDSLLFVFGKRAKEMRFSKLNELIHVSADATKQPKKGSVAVEFVEIQDRPGEEYQEIPGTEFSIKRVVRQDGISEYYIDSEKSKQDDVVDLLKSKGIDLKNNRFLIL
jgi:structural maintenance of chromosome 4